MPSNEEEIMRHILSLSHQIKYTRDIPQVVISFEEQTNDSLIFTVILLRLLKTDSKPVKELFQETQSFLNFTLDRSKIVGYLRKRYAKEATIFRVMLGKESFLRADHTIDLYKARQSVVIELSRIVGEFRDFNGGMIAKQSELLSLVRSAVSEVGKYDDLLLENFFYSLHPVIMRNVLEPTALKTLFLMLEEILEEIPEKMQNYLCKMRSEANFIYIMLALPQHKLKEDIENKLAALSIPTTDLAITFIRRYDTSCVGYIYRSDNEKKRTQFCDTILHALSQSDLQICAKRLVHA